MPPLSINKTLIYDLLNSSVAALAPPAEALMSDWSVSDSAGLPGPERVT